MNSRIERETYFEPRLVQMFRAAERKRRWYHTINWGPICGALIAIGVSSLAWWGLISAVIYVKGW